MKIAVPHCKFFNFIDFVVFEILLFCWILILKNLFRGSGNKSNDSDEEESKSLNFKPADTGVAKANSLFDKLGDKFIAGEQKLMNSDKPTLIFSMKSQGKLYKKKYKFKKWKKIGDFIDGVVSRHKGDNDEATVEVESDDSYDSTELRDCDQQSSRSRSPSPSFSDSDDYATESPDPELKDFILIKMINRGGFGKVFLVKNSLDDKYYAMKRIRKDLLIETGQIDNTLNERELLLSNDNPFLLRMFYVFQSEFRLYFFMEYVDGGNLYENMFSNKRFTEKQVKFFAVQLVIALGYLHTNKVIHRDLKPENVILRRNGYIVLADFGLAKILDTDNDFAKTYCGTSEYMAPEIIRGKKQSYTVDWWTLGILVYELICGKSPFRDKVAKNQRMKIQKGIYFFFNVTNNHPIREHSMARLSKTRYISQQRYEGLHNTTTEEGSWR